MSNGKLYLGATDYTIFGATLLVSSAIGVYFQLVSKKTNEEYLLAGKSMGIFPVSFSLMATFMSSTTLMGIPAEMYSFGTNMIFMNVGFALGPLIAAYLFLPVFYKNDCTTTYEFLELRFGVLIRRVLSGLFSLQNILFTAASLYAPALALSAVTNLSMWMSIVSIGTVCTFYSSLGGMKAVMWADVFQAGLMYVCLLAVLIKGCLLLGGIQNVFDINYNGGRFLVPEFSLDLQAHYTLPNILMQGLIITLSGYGCGQAQVQRVLAVKSIKRAKTAFLLSAPMLIVFHLLCCCCGFVIYAFFRDCDPLSAPNHPITSADQLLPFFITTTMRNIPGLSGLCISGVFSATLSTVSSSLNALSSVAMQDFLRPIFPNKDFTVLHSKIISFSCGTICMFLAFTLASFGNLIRMTVVITGLVAGPQLAVFILALFTKTANQKGAVLGVIVGFSIGACLSFIPEVAVDPTLPLSNECPLIRIDTHATSFPERSIFLESYREENKPFKLAYMWIAPIALGSTFFIGLAFSFLANCFGGEKHDVSPDHLSPMRNFFSRKNIETEKIDQKLTSISKQVQQNETYI